MEMQLCDFVAETLRQVMRGVKAGQAYCAETGGAVHPSSVTCSTANPHELFHPELGVVVKQVEFDVAVTATQDTQTNGVVAVVHPGARGQAAKNTESISRVRFSVPVILPVSEEAKLRQGRARESRDINRDPTGLTRW